MGEAGRCFVLGLLDFVQFDPQVVEGCVRDQPCENSAFAGKRFAYFSPVPRCNVSQNTSEVITLHWRRFRYRNLMGLIALDVLHVTVVVAVRESAYKGEERPRRPWCSAAGSARPRLRRGLAAPSAPHRRRGLRPAAPSSGPAAARRALCVHLVFLCSLTEVLPKSQSRFRR